MKKIISLLLLLTLMLSVLCSCGSDTSVIRIGVMSGPTGMGMAKLMSDNKDDTTKYEFTVYADPSTATGYLLSGELDMLCIPTNTAAMLENKKADTLTVLAVNTLGSLYLITNGETTINSVKDLEGKTIYASVPGSTTGPIINYILEKNGVNATVEFEATHDALVERIQKNDVSIAVLPEPKVSAAVFKNKSYSVALDLSEEWSKVSDTPLTMGCIVVRNDFLAEHKSVVKSFLKEYKSSIQYITDEKNEDAAQIIIDVGVIPAALPVVKGALGNLRDSIVYLDGKDMKAALQDFYSVIGLASPGDDFYYE